MFERAIGLDPTYAPAWAGLADVHAWLYEWWGGSQEDIAGAERASRKALEFAPDLAEAHASRGFLLALSGRYDEAAREFEEAIRLNPRLYDALYYYARASFANGDVERSAELFRRAGDARQEDFQSIILLSQSLKMLNRADDWQDAIREGIRRVEHVLELDPTDARALSMCAGALAEVGQRDRALRLSSVPSQKFVRRIVRPCRESRLRLQSRRTAYSRGCSGANSPRSQLPARARSRRCRVECGGS